MAFNREAAVLASRVEYNRQKAAALASLAEIKAILDADRVEAPHWGHVGDMTQTAQDLAQITDRLLGRGEWAV